MCWQPIIHMQRVHMRFNNVFVLMCGLVLWMTFWLAHTYPRDSVVKAILFFWKKCYRNCCMMFRSPFVTACGFSMTERQLTSALSALSECHVWHSIGWTWWTSPFYSPISRFIDPRLLFMRTSKVSCLWDSTYSDEDLNARVIEVVARVRELLGIFERVRVASTSSFQASLTFPWPFQKIFPDFGVRVQLLNISIDIHISFFLCKYK